MASPTAIDAGFLPVDVGQYCIPVAPEEEDRRRSSVDSVGDRVRNDVPPPNVDRLAAGALFAESDGHPQLLLLRSHLFREGRLTCAAAAVLLRRGIELLKSLPNVLEVDAPVVVVGDIHGQYYDLLQILRAGGNGNVDSDTQFLFLGDYVDRGAFSCEVVLYLIALKLNHPTRVHLLRGNHESRLMANHFTFFKECLCKYDEEIYELFMQLFDCLPLAAVVRVEAAYNVKDSTEGEKEKIATQSKDAKDEKAKTRDTETGRDDRETKQLRFLCMHGGIGPRTKTIQDINDIDRVSEVGKKGSLCDLLWSDPLKEDKSLIKSAEDLEEVLEIDFMPNPIRGCSYFYGYAAVTAFLKKNNITSLVRAHEVQEDGFMEHRQSPYSPFPTVITVFSAPNYCDTYGNRGAFMRIGPSNMSLNNSDGCTQNTPWPYEFHRFTWQPHPYTLPNFNNAFEHSMPMVAESVLQLLVAVTTHMLPTDLKQEDGSDETAEAQATRAKVAARVRAASVMMKMFRTLREEEQAIVELKGLVPSHQIPRGVLMGGKDAIAESISDFQKAKSMDLVNERFPSSVSGSRRDNEMKQEWINGGMYRASQQSNLPDVDYGV